MATQIRLCLETREPFAHGLSSGDVGPYERLVGRVFFAVDVPGIHTPHVEVCLETFT